MFHMIQVILLALLQDWDLMTLAPIVLQTACFAPHVLIRIESYQLSYGKFNRNHLFLLIIQFENFLFLLPIQRRDCVFSGSVSWSNKIYYFFNIYQFHTIFFTIVIIVLLYCLLLNITMFTYTKQSCDQIQSFIILIIILLMNT